MLCFFKDTDQHSDERTFETWPQYETDCNKRSRTGNTFWCKPGHRRWKFCTNTYASFVAINGSVYDDGYIINSAKKTQTNWWSPGRSIEHACRKPPQSIHKRNDEFPPHQPRRRFRRLKACIRTLPQKLLQRLCNVPTFRMHSRMDSGGGEGVKNDLFSTQIYSWAIRVIVWTMGIKHSPWIYSWILVHIKK